MTRQANIAFLVILTTVLLTICESRHHVRVARQSKVPASFDHAPQQHLGNRFGGDSIVPKLKCSCTYVRDYAEEAMSSTEHKVDVEIDGHIEEHKTSHMTADAKTEETQVETEPSNQKSPMK